MLLRIPFTKVLSCRYAPTANRRGIQRYLPPPYNPFPTFFLVRRRQLFWTEKDTLSKPPTKRRTWDENYALLVKYYEEHGHANVPGKYNLDTKLGWWVVNQRRKKKHSLSPAKIAKLEALNITWEGATTKRRTWEENYSLLVKYYEEHGHANVPGTYKEDPKLGWWVGDQRRSKKKHNLSPDKIAKLEDLNIIWEGANKDNYNQQWEVMFRCLEEFTAKEGHCNVTNNYKPNRKLGKWVDNQRQNYKRGKLTPDRITKLESIGFVWRRYNFNGRAFNGDLEEQWMHKFDQLLEYWKENGHFQVPQQYKKNPSLGAWVHNQRTRHAAGCLCPVRKDLLDAIGFPWNRGEILNQAWHQAWNNMFDQLIQLQKKENRNGPLTLNGKLAPNGSKIRTWAIHGKQPELWSWEQEQQHLYLSGTLHQTREAFLDDIGYWESVGISKE